MIDVRRASRVLGPGQARLSATTLDDVVAAHDAMAIRSPVTTARDRRPSYWLSGVTSRSAASDVAMQIESSGDGAGTAAPQHGGEPAASRAGRRPSSGAASKTTSRPGSTSSSTADVAEVEGEHRASVGRSVRTNDDRLVEPLDRLLGLPGVHDRMPAADGEQLRVGVEHAACSGCAAIDGSRTAPRTSPGRQGQRRLQPSRRRRTRGGGPAASPRAAPGRRGRRRTGTARSRRTPRP